MYPEQSFDFLIGSDLRGFGKIREFLFREMEFFIDFSREIKGI